MKQLLIIVAMCCASVAWAADKAPPSQIPPLKGVVLEVMEVDIYTYVRLKTATGETWAAVPKAPVTKGSEVTIEGPMTMDNFESKTLKRKFDKIVFGTLGGKARARTAARRRAASIAAAHEGVGKAADIGDIKVTKASGRTRARWRRSPPRRRNSRTSPSSCEARS